MCSIKKLHKKSKEIGYSSYRCIIMGGIRFSNRHNTLRTFLKYSSQTTERKTKGFVYISKNADDEMIIMSPVCTHLGCTVPFADEAEGY